MSQYLGDTDLRVVEARLGYLIRLWIEGGAERQRERDHSAGPVLSVHSRAPESGVPALRGKLSH